MKDTYPTKITAYSMVLNAAVADVHITGFSFQHIPSLYKKNLDFEFNPGSIITAFKIEEWKK
jgi:hypothetical protein